MLSLSVVNLIAYLLQKKQLSKRKIAKLLSVSRGTVGAIANGNRGLYGKEPRSKGPYEPEVDLPPARCNGCGAMVFMPCLLCETRAYIVRQQQEQKAAQQGKSLPEINDVKKRQEQLYFRQETVYSNAAPAQTSGRLRATAQVRSPMRDSVKNPAAYISKEHHVA